MSLRECLGRYVTDACWGEILGLVLMDIKLMGGMDLPRVEYIEGNEQLLDEARILWEELIQDHRVKLKHFTSGYHNRNFDDRKAGLVEKAKTAVLRIDLVKILTKIKLLVIVFALLEQVSLC